MHPHEKGFEDKGKKDSNKIRNSRSSKSPRNPHTENFPQPLCRRSHDGSSGRGSGSSLFRFLLRFRFSRCTSLICRVLKRSNRRGLFNFRGVLINLGRSGNLSLGLGLEEVTNTSRETASDFGGSRDLILFLLLLLYIEIRRDEFKRTRTNKPYLLLLQQEQRRPPQQARQSHLGYVRFEIQR